MEYSKIKELDRLQEEMRDKISEILPIIREYTDLPEYEFANYFEPKEMCLARKFDKKKGDTSLVVWANSSYYFISIPVTYLSMTSDEVRKELDKMRKAKEDAKRALEEKKKQYKEARDRREYERLKAKFG